MATDDLMAGLPDKIEGEPIMPTPMRHFDYGSEGELSQSGEYPITEPEVMTESLDDRLQKVVEERRKRIADLTQSRKERLSERPIAGPLTAEQQKEALALAERNARSNDSGVDSIAA